MSNVKKHYAHSIEALRQYKNVALIVFTRSARYHLYRQELTWFICKEDEGELGLKAGRDVGNVMLSTLSTLSGACRRWMEMRLTGELGIASARAGADLHHCGLTLSLGGESGCEICDRCPLGANGRLTKAIK